MIQRCSNPKSTFYRYYGEIGITVCDRWKDFENFLADMGQKPSQDHSLDRYPNNDGNYEPGNVRWADKFQQSGNRRNCIMVEVRGKEVCLKEASRILGRNYDTVRHRIYRGMSPDEALRT